MRGRRPGRTYLGYAGQALALTNERPHLVLDTNVMLEQVSVVDLERSLEKYGESADYYYRKERARYSILLAWHLHRRRLRSASVLDEFTRTMERAVDPADMTSPTRQFAALVGHYVLPYVLHRWKVSAIADAPKTIQGSAVDDFLIQVASDDQVPVITNEGYGLGGVAPKARNIRGKGKKAGIKVYTPEQYLRRKNVDLNLAARKFLAAYHREWDAAAEQEKYSASMAQAAGYLYQIYEFVLLAPVPDEFRPPREPENGGG